MTEHELKFWNASEDQLGRFGERVWGNLLTAGGFEFIPLCEVTPKNGVGPRTSAGTIMLDFDVSKPGRRRRFYIDSKCKKHRAIFPQRRQ